ncbi:MAG: hypothetical protein QOF84_3434 [Streptomyces sp.]|nr:hypothetical protein [Streptomyces sp.]
MTTAAEAESGTRLSYPRAMLGSVQTQSVSPVFVGRSRELTRLTSALARACAGEPQALLVGGEAGVGKSRLLEEFLGAAAASGAVTAVGGCVEIGADGLPFAPVSTVLRVLHRQLGDELAAAAAGQEGELALLLPELGETDRESHDEHGRARLFELTARLLERLADGRTLVIALEDLHWADKSTRELLAYLFRSLHRGRLIVIATYRSDDIHRRHPLRPFLAELDRMRTVERIELARFNRTEVRQQVAGILAAEPVQAFVDTVFKRSDGNPFFVEELACSITQGCRTGLSDSLRDLLLVRLETLPDGAQRVARVVAEGGSTVEYALLAAVAGLSEDDLIEALRAAVGANILLPTDDGDGYRFRHSLVREAVGDDLLPGERGRISRRYAQALEADPTLIRSDERPARLASYWYHAHDAAKALPAVLRASVEARRRHAYAEQRHMLERALELWDSVPDEVRERLILADYGEIYPLWCGCDPGATRLRQLDLMSEITVAARRSGERERALAVARRALRTLEDADDPLSSAWFWVQCSRLTEDLARGDGWDEIGKAQELVRGLPPSAVHAEVLVAAASWGMIHAPGPDALATAQRAVELARLVGAEDTELDARTTLGIIMVDAGSIDEGLAELRAVRDRAVELEAAGAICRSGINLSAALEAVGRSAESAEAAGAAAEAAARFGLRDQRAFALSNRAASLLAMGRWTEAADAVKEAGEAATSAITRGWVLLMTAHLDALRGDFTAAAECAAAARATLGSGQAGPPQQAIPFHALAVAVEAGHGRFVQARTEAQAALDAGFAPGMHRHAWPLLYAAAAVESDAIGLPAAEPGRAEMLARLRKAATKLPTLAPVWAAYALLVEAELSRAEGHSDPAPWSAAEAAFAALDRPYQLARIRLRLAEAHLAHGDRKAATALLTAAHATADRLGAGPVREEAALLAERARIPLGGAAVPVLPDDDPAAPADLVEPFGLTSREREVLRHVAAGHTNRRIAEELFISPKTASVHVSNILAKLSVSSRGEAAALAHRLRLFADPVGS